MSVLFLVIDRSDRMAQLLDERDLGVLTSSMSLLVALVSNNHEAYWSCLPKCVKTLERLARNQDIPQEYTYYGIPSPWLQVCAFLHTFSRNKRDTYIIWDITIFCWLPFIYPIKICAELPVSRGALRVSLNCFYHLTICICSCSLFRLRR